MRRFKRAVPYGQEQIGHFSRPEFPLIALRESGILPTFARAERKKNFSPNVIKTIKKIASNTPQFNYER